MESLNDLWDYIIKHIDSSVSDIGIDSWFKDCKVIEMTDTSIIVLSPNEFQANVLRMRYSDKINRVLRDLFGDNMRVDIVVNAPESEKDTYNQSYDYTFENFVVGPSNKLAHAAALAVANKETTLYNPLFLYGDSGLGKTHLLYAIMNRAIKNDPKCKVVFVRTRDFMNELIEAIRSGHNVEFRDKYRKADLFLMDDIQAIGGTNSSQDECFHTFNTLHEAHKQMVFASDRPPSEVPLLTDRMRTRFESGLIVDIQKPDFETRVAIIQKKSTQVGLNLSDDVTKYVAANVTANVRQIEGAIKKLRAYNDMMHLDITVSVVSNEIKGMYLDKQDDYGPTPDKIIEETAKFYELSVKDLTGKRRTKDVVLARQVAMYQIRNYTTLSLNEIGKFFGGRDHTTVLSSVQKIEQEANNSPAFAKDLKKLAHTFDR